MNPEPDPRAAAMEIVGRLTGPGGPHELVEEDVLGAKIPVFRNRARSVAALLQESLQYGDREYLVTENERITFAEHHARVASLATALREQHGVGPGDRVAIAAANSPAWVVAFWASVSLGAIAVGFNAWWTRPEMEYAVGHSEPQLVLADARRAELLDGAGAPVVSLEELDELVGAHPGATLPQPEVDEDSPAVILYTSGTSGRPKGAVHTQRNLLAVVEFHRYNDALAAAFGAPVPGPDKRYLMVLPLFHIASLHNLAIPRLATGSTAVIHLGAFDADRVLRLIEAERVTNWGAVPTMASRLLDHGDVGRYDTSSLTAFALASAPSSPAFKKRVREELPFARNSLADSYGLTESCTGATVASPMDLEESPGTLGRPVVGVQLEIRDPAGNALPPGEEGEVCLRSQYNMLGYWRDPDATAAAITEDRWLRTGDIGTLDEQGRLRLTTRRSDLILRGGENVYPVEIEGVLAEHDAVREVVVLGVPHEDLGQEVMAVVVTDDPTAVAEKELRDFAAERLAYFKVPSRWHITTESLPRTATGKVVRREVEASL